MLLKHPIQGPLVTGLSDEGFSYSVLQFGNKVYQEIPLGAAHNLQTFIPRVLNITFRNDEYNDVEGAIRAATQMLEAR